MYMRNSVLLLELVGIMRGLVDRQPKIRKRKQSRKVVATRVGGREVLMERLGSCHVPTAIRLDGWRGYVGRPPASPPHTH